jgi:hypothetical protein
MKKVLNKNIVKKMSEEMWHDDVICTMKAKTPGLVRIWTTMDDTEVTHAIQCEKLFSVITSIEDDMFTILDLPRCGIVE